MFSDLNTKVIGFQSIPETERSVNDSGCQTSSVLTSNQETQTTSSQPVSSETTADMSKSFGDQLYDSDKLLKFLNRIMPHLEEELKSNNFKNDLSTEPNVDIFEHTVSEEQESLDHSCRRTIIRPDFCNGKVVSSLSWNASNVMLAVTCSELTHTDWCCHESVVGLYNTGKVEFEKNPFQLLKVPGCVRCVVFHDQIPSLLAAGLYSGEVVVWDLKHDENILVNIKKKSVDEYAHVDVISFLTWREDENDLLLVSAGRDGRIILWKVSSTNLTYEVSQRFIILKQHLIATAAPDEHLEVIHMDFKPSKSSYFIAACGGGITFYCSTTMAKSLTSPLHYKDPILLSYKPRKGIVTCVSCNTDVFASCGTDSEIHIFKYDQESPVFRLHTSYPAFGVRWNTPTELISWGTSYIECQKVQVSGRKTTICEFDGGISAVAFKISSATNSRKFAIGNQRGDILILGNWNST